MILSDDGSTTFEQPPTGSHAARCIAIIDLGTQRGTYEGQPQIKRQIIVRWELPNELMAEGEFAGKPFTVSKFYTASLGEKANLRKDLASWRGRDFTAQELKGFDVLSIIGKPCMLGVGANDKGKAKVTSVMALPKGMTIPTQINESFNFSLDAKEFSAAKFEALSKGFKKMVEASPEYQKIVRRGNAAPEPDYHDDMGEGVPAGIDDIPF